MNYKETNDVKEELKIVIKRLFDIARGGNQRRGNQVKQQLLCIATSKRVLRRLFAGRNNFFDAKTTFSVTYGTK